MKIRSIELASIFLIAVIQPSFSRAGLLMSTGPSMVPTVSHQVRLSFRRGVRMLHVIIWVVGNSIGTHLSSTKSTMEDHR